MAASTQLLSLAATYERQGFVAPLRAIPGDAAAQLAAKVEGYAQDERSKKYLGADSHVVFDFVDKLVREDAVLDAVEAVLGPDIMLLRAAFFIKSPNSPGHVTWHQDLTYWGLDRDEEVTAWIAFSPATQDNGCMRFVPGSHRHGIVEHVDTVDSNNLLSRSQVIKVEVDETQAVPAVLDAGEMSLHHGQIYHASGPNRTDGWRIGLAARYITPRMQQVVGSKDHAALLRGEDRFNHFSAPPRPTVELDPAGIAFYESVAESKKEFLFQERG